ncbi:MAG: LLM class F420-dependent oxidoreductase [Candidatus Lambdaproteobacteria bacterium]|nr:LLM class F420-dependent oxidoreductase [Candidatus Lambdaproteobacteria bacterium]
MRYGILMFQADFAMHPAELAREVEARGFESLFFPEHTHIPSKRLSPWSPRNDPLPEMYAHMHDVFVAMTAAAMVTQKLIVASGICLVVERDPIITAKEVASLDQLSGGRFEFGIGGGWNREEMENHGTEFGTRWKLMRERIEAMKAIWSEERATYHGEFVNFDEIWSWPKPLQKPHPPILVAGNGARTLQRVARYGDGWLPLPQGLDSFTDKLKELEDLCAAAGRPMVPVSLFYAPTSKPAKLAQFRAEGVSRFVWSVPSAGRDVVLPKLDELARLKEQLGA